MVSAEVRKNMLQQLPKPTFVDRLSGAYGILLKRAEQLEEEAAEMRRRAKALKDRGMDYDHDAMEEERARSCTGKKRYRTEKGAGTAAGAATAERDVKLRTYRCVFCDGWHLTKLDLAGFAQNVERAREEGSSAAEGETTTPAPESPPPSEPPPSAGRRSE